MRLYTIGCTQTSAASFFSRVSQSGATAVVDVRLNNVSQLAGFAKRDDLRYFLDVIGGVGYEHRPELAPSKELFDAYRKRGLDWSTFAREFLALMAAREVEHTVSRTVVDGACLLCSEPEADRCHRRLVAEYLRGAWGDVQVTHL